MVNEQSVPSSKDYLKFFVSQNEQEYYPEHSCGAAALLTLLKWYDFTPLPSYKELCDALSISGDPTLDGYSSAHPKVGIYPEHLFRFCINNHLNFRMFFYEDEWKECLSRGPIIALTIGSEDGVGPQAHWIVIIKRIRDVFVYFDPWYKQEEKFKKYISAVDFRRYYSGIALQIIK